MAITVLSGAAAIGFRAGGTLLPFMATVAGENVFLAVMTLGLAVLVASIRWTPPLGRNGRRLTLFIGAGCSVASLCFGIKGLALILSASATVDLVFAAKSGSGTPP